MSQKALLIVDVQNDFCPGGTLAVPQGDEVVPVLNQYLEYFQKHKYPIFASRDWHPPTTNHFQEYGGLWPKHCVQKTRGAEFHPQLKLPKSTIILSKGMDPMTDSYSAYQGVDDKKQTFSSLLKENKIRELFVGGLATDYCVKASVLDGLEAGLTVYLLEDAVRGVDINKGDTQQAIEEMEEKGAKFITIDGIMSGLIKGGG